MERHDHRIQCLLSRERVNNVNGSEVEPHVALSASTLNHPAPGIHTVVLLSVQGHNVCMPVDLPGHLH